jgi:WD40 repeat protein
MTIQPSSPAVPAKASHGRVFLSYGHDEICSALVTRMEADLRNHGWECWLDKQRIEFGDEWRQQITAGILQSDHMLAFLSRHSTRKPGVCRQEVAIALNARQCNVYTVLVEPLSDVTPPLLISQRQWLDMQHWAVLQNSDPIAAEELYQQSLEEILRVLQNNQPFAGQIDALNQWLKPLDCTADMIAAEDAFSGRQWLLGDIGETRSGGEADSNDEPTGELEQWRISGSANRVFWLAAEPGWGKSAVAARLAHAGRARVMAVHFCKYDRPQTRDASWVLRTVAFQMATQLGEYRELLLKRAQDGLDLNSLSPAELFHELLANPLSFVIEGGRSASDRHLIVIDALDETLDTRGRSELVSLLAGEFDKLPPWLGLVVTSRPEAPIQRQFARHGVLLLSAADPRNLADLRNYAAQWLQRLPIAAADQHATLESVLTAADGNFLYLRQLQAGLETGVFTLTQLGQVSQLPSGLARLYERWFQHRFADIAHYEQKLRPLFELLLAAREPLPLTLAAAALAWDAYGARVVDELGSLIKVSDGTVTLFHKSLRDWLADPEVSGWDYCASEEEGHRRLAAALMSAYQDWQAAGAMLHSNAGWERLGNNGIPYVLRHLPAHLSAIGDAQTRARVLTDFALALRRCAPEVLGALLDDYRGQLPKQSEAGLADWSDCIKTNSHLLRRGNEDWPAYKIFLQIAMDDADESAITQAAERWLASGACDWMWLRRRNRPEQRVCNGLIAVLEGHTCSVYGAEPLPDDRLLSWSADGTLRLWDCASGAGLAVLEGHRKSVLGTQVLPDGRLLSWSDDDTLRLWEGVSGAALAVLEGHIGPVVGAQTLPDGRLLSWSDDGTLRMWEGVSGAVLAVLEGHTGCVNGTQVLPDGRLLSWSDDGTLRLWEGVSGAVLAVLEGHIGPVVGAQTLPDGRLLSWSDDGTLRLWEGVRGAVLAVLEGHIGPVVGAQTLPDGRLLSWSKDGTLRLWDSASGAGLAVMEGHTEWVNGAQVLLDGQLLSWSWDNTLRLWEAATGAALAVLEGHTECVWGAQALPDGRLLSWSADGTLRLWDGASGAVLAVLEGHSGTVRDARALPSGQMLSWSNDGTLRLWEGSSSFAFPELEGHADCVNGIQVLFDGRLLSWSDDGTLRLWDSERGAALATLDGHTGWVNGAQVLPDGRFLSWSADGSLRLWDGGSGAALAVLKEHTGCVSSVQVLPDGRLLSCSWDSMFLLWDGTSGAIVAELVGHTDKVNNAKLLPDGRLLSCSDDGTLRLWDSESGEDLTLLEGHTRSVIGAQALPDGRLLSWSWDATLRVWEGHSGATLAVLEGHSARVEGAQALPGSRLVSWSSDDTLLTWDLNTYSQVEVIHQPWTETAAYPAPWECKNEIAGALRFGEFWVQVRDNHLTVINRSKKTSAKWHSQKPALFGSSAGHLVAASGRHLLLLDLMQGNQQRMISSHSDSVSSSSTSIA